MEYYGVNPQGYHGINFGSFVPKPSFKVRQLAASSARRDATISTTADREDYGYIRRQQQYRDTRRLRGCSLPEIKVKRLLKEPKKKHSGAHTFGGASSEKMRFPVIVPTADKTNPNAPTPRRGPQWMGENERDRERRVVRNGEPWWKWSKRHHDDDKQTGRNHSHKQRLPQMENLSAQHRSREKAKHVQHNLRQKLPPLLGYRDDNGNLTFSEAENDVNMRALGNKSSRNVFMNRRYYYSYSRDGIRPCHPEAKVSNAYLYDLSNLQPSNPDYAAHHEAMISSMHNELQAVTGVLPLQGGSTLGAKVKQSLNRSHERNAKKWRKQPVVINIDSSYADSELEEEEKEEKGATTAPVTKYPKTLNQNHLKALAILQELINVLNSAEFVPSSEYSGSNEASSVSEVPILSQINLGDFFQKPESVIKQYDRFKNITRSVHPPPNDDTSAEQVKLEHKEKHKYSHLEEKDHFGLTQLMAVHRLQSGSYENLSSVDLNSAAAKLTTRAYDSQNIDKIKTSSESFKSRSNKRDESILGDNNQHPELAQLLAVQQFQALNGNLSSAEVPNESKNVPNFTDSDEIGVSHHSFTQKSLSEKCDIQAQLILVCVNLNDQFLQFSNGRPKKQFLKRHPSNWKSVHNVSKLLIEPAEKQQNPRPDLVISGERLKHLYNLGLLNGDQELSQLAIKAQERVAVSREQLTRFQEICDQAGVAIGDSTIPHPGEVSAVENITDDSDLPGIEVNMDDHSGIDYTDASDHGHEIKGLLFEADTEQEDGGVDGRHQDQLGNTALKFSRDLSWDLESEFARVQAMDLQQRLQMEQVKKEKKVLDSVKRDLQRFQETLHGGSGSESGERPVRQRESLLPPPPPPRKKNKSRASKKNEQQRKIEDASVSSDLSASEVEGLGMENIESGESDMEDFGSTSSVSEQYLNEFGDQLLDNQLDSSSIIAVDNESAREGDHVDDQSDFIEHSETRYPTIPDVIEEESDGYLSDSDIDENTHSDDESQQSQTSLASKELLPKSVLEEENQPEVEIDNNAESEDISTRAVYNSVVSDLTNSESTHEQKEQEHRTSTSQRTNTRGGGRPVSKLVNMDSWSHSVDAGGIGSGRSSDSTRGMRGSALRSQRGKRTSSSESKGASIGEDMGLSVSRPQTVQQIDVGLRTSSGQRSRLPTRERSRKSSRAQMTVADPTQVLVHRKSELAKQQLIEAQRKEAQLAQERERQRQEKLVRQAEFEDRMSAAFKSEEDEIRRQRKLKAEARRKAEELEEQRQALVRRMKREEAQKEAEEKARHSAMLEGLRQEAERRHLQVMHEKGVIEDYQDHISAFNEWEYAYIDYYLGDSYSQEARKIDQSMKLKQEQFLHQKMMEAFEYKRKELLEKLKAAQKELMMELELEKGELDHFMKISRAFVFTYFKRVPDQTFMIPQELLI